MSAALNSRPDASTSTGTIPDLSLGSLNSGISTTPGRPGLRVPSSTSSGTTAPSSAPLSTPSPPAPSAFSKRKVEEGTPAARRYGLSGHEEDGDGDGDLLNTPAWGDGPDTPVAGTRPKRTRSGASGSKGSNLTLRDQEKVRRLI